MKSFRNRYVILGFLPSIFLLSCQPHKSTKQEIIRNVILTDVASTGETTEKTYSGIVQEGKSVNAAFMTGGKLLSLNVKEGDRVCKGQLLAVLDDADYKIGYNQLKVQYDQMTAEKKRMDEMYARHNIAPNDYEKFEAGFEQLKLQLEMMENKLGYTRLYSPSDGFIAYKYLQPGELVDAGTPIYKITDDSSLEVSVDLPLSIFLNKHDINNVYGLAAGGKERIDLKMESFTPDADNNQLYHMKLSVPKSQNNALTTGMNMPVVLEIENEIRGESMIPSRAIFSENGISYIWSFNEGDSTLSKQKVTIIGQPHGELSLVTGLNGNEKIVSAGVKQLKEGEKVNVVSNPLSTK